MYPFFNNPNGYTFNPYGVNPPAQPPPPGHMRAEDARRYEERIKQLQSQLKKSNEEKEQLMRTSKRLSHNDVPNLQHQLRQVNAENGQLLSYLYDVMTENEKLKAKISGLQQAAVTLVDNVERLGSGEREDCRETKGDEITRTFSPVSKADVLTARKGEQRDENNNHEEEINDTMIEVAPEIREANEIAPKPVETNVDEESASDSEDDLSMIVNKCDSPSDGHSERAIDAEANNDGCAIVDCLTNCVETDPNETVITLESDSENDTTLETSKSPLEDVITIDSDSEVGIEVARQEDQHELSDDAMEIDEDSDIIVDENESTESNGSEDSTDASANAAIEGDEWSELEARIKEHKKLISAAQNKARSVFEEADVSKERYKKAFAEWKMEEQQAENERFRTALENAGISAKRIYEAFEGKNWGKVETKPFRQSDEEWKRNYSQLLKLRF